MTDEKRVNSLHELKGRKFISVCFVLNYIVLAFEKLSFSDDAILHCYTYPLVVREKIFILSTPGYQDALCNLIASHVTAASLTDEGLTLKFEGDNALTIPLTAEYRRGPEAIYFLRGIHWWVI